MANYGQLISVLLEHSQRFIDFWNLQLVIALGVLGFCLANQKIVSRLSVRLLISLVFIAIAAFSVFSLSAHQERAEKLWLHSKRTLPPRRVNSSPKMQPISIP